MENGLCSTHAKSHADMTWMGQIVQWNKKVGALCKRRSSSLGNQTDKVAWVKAEEDGSISWKWDGELFRNRSNRLSWWRRKTSYSWSSNTEASEIGCSKCFKTMTQSDAYDIVVTGGGLLVTYLLLRQSISGKAALLRNLKLLGGTCLNRGCIPIQDLPPQRWWSGARKRET